MTLFFQALYQSQLQLRSAVTTLFVPVPPSPMTNLTFGLLTSIHLFTQPNTHLMAQVVKGRKSHPPLRTSTARNEENESTQTGSEAHRALLQGGFYRPARSF
jgi:hypothetical protein